METTTKLTETEKLNYIIKQIKCYPNDSDFIKKAKEIKIKYYTNSSKLLNKISDEKIYSFSFQNEIIQYSEKLEKITIINEILNRKKIKLESHGYAPELNKAFVNKELILCPHVVEIDKKITKSQLSQNFKSINLKQHLAKYSLNYLQILLHFN
jgi:hypothetical protein